MLRILEARKQNIPDEDPRMAVAYCVYLVEELQPAFKTRMKEAIATFEEFFFRVHPKLSRPQVEALLRGYNGRRGIIQSCGLVSWKKAMGLKMSSGMALNLLDKLLAPESNPDHTLFKRVFVETDKGILKQMKLSKHLAVKDGPNRPAAQRISRLLLTRGSLSDLTIMNLQQEIEESKSPAAGEPSNSQTSVTPKATPSQMGKVKVSDEASPFGKVFNMLSNFFKKRPKADDLQKRGVLKQGKVFGRPLQEVVADNGVNGVPAIMVQCCDFLVRHSLHAPGLFRVSGDSSHIQLLKKAFDFEDSVSLAEEDIHTVSGLLKLFLRELAEPLLTFERYSAFVDEFRSENLDNVRDLAGSLPSPHKETFQYLLSFLARVAQYQHVNKMTEANLAIVFAPNLLRPKVETYEAVARDTPVCIGCMKFLLIEEGTRLSKLVRHSVSHNAPPAAAQPGHVPKPSKEIAAQALSVVGGVSLSTAHHKVAKMSMFASTNQQPLADRPSQSQVSQPSPQSQSVSQPGQAQSETKTSSPPVNVDELPKPWQEFPDPQSGMNFYYNPETGVTQWERPRKHRRLGSSTSEVAPQVLSAGPMDMKTLTADIPLKLTLDGERPEPDPVFGDDPFLGPPESSPEKDSPVAEAKHLVNVDKHRKEGDFSKKAGSQKEEIAEPRARHNTELIKRGDSLAISNLSSPKTQEQQTKQASTPATQDEKGLDKRLVDQGWTKHIDPSSGSTFYYNTNTKQSSWVLPELPEAAKSEEAKPDVSRTSGENDIQEVSRLKSTGVCRLEGFGGWDETSSGGCHPNFPTWRNNPQYSLSLSQVASPDKTEVVTVTLERTSDTDKTDDDAPAIGFYVFKNTGPSAQKLFVSDDDHLARSEFVTDITTTCDFRLEEGVNCVLIPTTFQPGYEGTYTLHLESKAHIKLELVGSSGRWEESNISGEWKGQTAGGCRNFDTWDRNPQFLITLAENSPETSEVVLVLSQEAAEAMPAVGFYVLNNEGELVGKGAFMKAPEVFCKFTVSSKMLPYLVVPCTFQQGVERSFRLSAYSPSDVSATLMDTV